MTPGPGPRAAPAVVPASTTCSLPARVIRSCWLDTADYSMAEQNWSPDAIGASRIPHNEIPGPGALSGISPGHAINAKAYFNPDTHRWQLTLPDLTTGGTIA